MKSEKQEETRGEISENSDTSVKCKAKRLRSAKLAIFYWTTIFFKMLVLHMKGLNTWQENFQTILVEANHLPNSCI
jgi:hypothetical protein